MKHSKLPSDYRWLNPGETLMPGDKQPRRGRWQSITNYDQPVATHYTYIRPINNIAYSPTITN